MNWRKNKMDILEEVKELKATKTKYDNLNARVSKHGAKLKQAIDLLQEILEDVDPYALKKERKGRTSLVTQVEEITDKMLHGQVITTKWIQDLYPNINPGQSNNIMTHLRKVPGVKEAKDGVQLKLFIVQEI